MNRPQISRRAKLLYLSLLLALAVIMVVGPAQAGSIGFTSVFLVAGTSATGFQETQVATLTASPGSVGLLTLTGGTVTCNSAQTCTSFFAYTIQAQLSGVSVGDRFALHVDGMLTGSADVAFTGSVYNANLLSTGIVSLGPGAFSLSTTAFVLDPTVGTNQVSARLAVANLAAGASFILPSSATVTIDATPEPGNFGLGTVGLAALGTVVWRRRRKLCR